MFYKMKINLLILLKILNNLYKHNNLYQSKLITYSSINYKYKKYYFNFLLKNEFIKKEGVKQKKRIIYKISFTNKGFDFYKKYENYLKLHEQFKKEFDTIK